MTTATAGGYTRLAEAQTLISTARAIDSLLIRIGTRIRLRLPRELRVVSPTVRVKYWNWRSEGDLFFNGAYFVPSGATGTDSAAYAKASSYGRAKTSSMVGAITSAAGALTCRKGHMCH